jgi:membrane protein required for colicin V production
MQEGNWVDYCIIGIMGLSVLMGILRGFVREALSLITWVTAIAVGILFCEEVATYFTSISIVAVRLILAFVLLVLAVLIVGGIVSYLIAKLVKMTGFGLTDRVIGTFFGAARGCAVIAFIMVVLEASIVSSSTVWKESALIPKFAPISLWIKARLPDDLVTKIKSFDKADELKIHHESSS